MPNQTQIASSDFHEPQKDSQGVRHYRILVIDDDSDDFFAIKRLIGQSTNHIYELDHINNFDDGIKALSVGDHDAALIDYHLGSRFGVEILENIEGNLELPVIVLTGSNDRAVEAAALKAGAFDFLDKNAMTSATLVRSLDFAIKRFSIEEKILENQERLRIACENAEAAHFSKSEFLEFLGSELQTPLNAILGFSQVMHEDSLGLGMPDMYRDYSETIHQSGARLLNLIDDLLDLSETDAESFNARNRRLKRYRTWIVDKQEARRQSLRENVS